MKQQLAELRLSADGTLAEMLRQVATEKERVLTTAVEVRGRILYLGGRFDQDEPSGPYEVITDPVGR